jgi:GT2 family glycosyltransferase
MSVTVLAVIVLFKKQPYESSALQSVLRAAASVPQGRLWLKVLLYDNTPGGQEPGVLLEHVEYRNASGNHGLASAYNEALRMANTERFDWLLTLDHDTTLPEHFLHRISEAIESLTSRPDIAAIVPEIWDHDVFISPNTISFGRSRRLPRQFVGVPQGEVAAINSATTWRVSAWRELGGFNPLFWLDYLDLWAFHAIQRAGYRIYVTGDLHVDHELSLLHQNSRMSPERFQNWVRARSAFVDLHKGVFDGALLTVQLASMLCSQTVKRESAVLRRLTWQCLKQRILMTPKRRIEAWSRDMMDHVPEPSDSFR